jgi:uncharacterized membrane protein YvlD (DUF360 family)
MIKFLVRLILTALTFLYVLPHIPGITFHGSLGVAIACAIAFGIVGWLVDLLAVVLSALWAISTLGLALLILIPLWLVGYFILPAVSLRVLADIIPQHLHIAGWIPAIEGGLVMLLLGILTSAKRPKKD